MTQRFYSSLIGVLFSICFFVTRPVHAVPKEPSSDSGQASVASEAKRKFALKLSKNFPTNFFIGQLAFYRMEYISGYPYREVFDNLFNANKKAFEVMKNLKPRFWQKDYIAEGEITAIWLTVAFARIATQSELNELEAFYIKELPLLGLRHPGLADEIERSWRSARPYIAARKGKLTSITGPVVNRFTMNARSYRNLNFGYQSASSLPRNLYPNRKYLPTRAQYQAQNISIAPGPINDLQLGELEKFLRKRLIGLGEVVDRIVKIERRYKIFSTKSADPELLMLNGLAGNGRDTAAEEWVDAVYGYHGASKEHLFRLDTISTVKEAWGTLGSTTGFAGSDSLSPFIRYLVEHSCGKYLIQIKPGMGKSSASVERVILNPDWQDQPLPGYHCRAFVFANEWHDWAKRATNIVLKQSVDKGIFTINNPGGGLKQIEVPGVSIVLASNYGINLIAARRLNGTRSGPPLTYDEMLRRHEKVKNNVALIKQNIMAANGQANSPDNSEDARGVSEEFLNRIPPSRIVLMKPLSPEELQNIVRIKLETLRYEYLENQGEFGTFQFEFSDALVKFVQEFQYSAEENARPMKDYVRSIVEDTLNELIFSGSLKTDSTPARWFVDVEQNSDGTSDLILTQRDDSGGIAPRVVTQFVTVTENQRHRETISDSEIDRILEKGESLKRRLISNQGHVDALINSILISEAGKYEKESLEKPRRKAHVSLFLGPSSLGKTQLAKDIAEAFTGSADNLKIIDFSSVRTLEALNAKVLGSRTQRGDGTPSDFMNYYDRGDRYFAFDELSNAPPEVHMALYDILREPEVTTFSDNTPRKMEDVNISITGNCGQEWYQNIPKTLPLAMRMFAMQRVYEKAMKNPGFQRQTLEKCFPAPLLARVDQIIFFKPFDFKELRKLTQLKVTGALNDLKPREGHRGWIVGFADENAYAQLLNDIEEQGFRVDDQGASITNYVKNDFQTRLQTLLLPNKVPSGSRVLLERVGLEDLGNNRQQLKYHVWVEGRAAPLDLIIPANEVEFVPEVKAENRMMVAGHESGHEISRKLLFKEKYISDHVSIIAGVDMFGDQMIVYEGVARWKPNQKFSISLEAVVNDLAVLHAGYLAQMLLSKNNFQDAGKHNDMQRASQLARRAILEFGLSPVWGNESIPTGVKMGDYISGLSEDRKKVLIEEERRLTRFAQERAVALLHRNRENLLIPMTEILAQRGFLEGEDFEKFYSEHKAQDFSAEDIDWAKKFLDQHLKASSSHASINLDPILDDDLRVPESIADLQSFAADERKRTRAEVSLSNQVPFFDRTAFGVSSQGIDECEAKLDGA